MPECLVQNAVIGPDGLDLHECGPDKASAQHDPTESAATPAAEDSDHLLDAMPFRAAVVDVEGATWTQSDYGTVPSRPPIVRKRRPQLPKPQEIMVTTTRLAKRKDTWRVREPKSRTL